MASESIPSPAAVAPGVWSMALPFPNPLRFAFSYAWRGPQGVVVIDAGWDSDECWQSFVEGLARSGAKVGDVVGVVVTHVHPDHYGLAGRIRSESSAWIAVHPAEKPRIADAEPDRARAIEEMADWLVSCGAPASELDELRADAADIRSHISTTQPDVVLTDGQEVPDTEGVLRAVHTPGHTPGHLCFHDRDRNLLFTGDHILPRVTPNISKRPQSDEDPLNDFIMSIDRIRGFGDPLVLPGHEWVFDRLDRRLEDLVTHHHERLADMELVVRAGASTVWEVAQAVRWSRPFGDLHGPARRSAIGETHAHLRRLEELDRLFRAPGRPDRWTPVGSPAAVTSD